MAAAKSGSLERGRGGSAASLPGTRGPPKCSHAGTRGAPTQPALKKEIGIPASAPHFHSSGAAAAMWKIPIPHPQQREMAPGGSGWGRCCANGRPLTTRAFFKNTPRPTASKAA